MNIVKNFLKKSVPEHIIPEMQTHLKGLGRNSEAHGLALSLKDVRRKNTNLNQRRSMFKLHKLKYSLLLILNRFRKMTLKYRRTDSLIFHPKEVAPKI